ncbi:Transmembrane BAX inhibitor motif-containing protein 1 [Fasciolopsis buskii]|uniref:Transmembrane BAX inhibitor motif-containing protein 1 n=1 Tax=Fasciolopsis buskii TaxID=27845 RepID=A0A8E0RY72_9TREM|nr:Transmembrane BAX inhibitor motif-containing protein 1 [Fasciolopsis buski]
MSGGAPYPTHGSQLPPPYPEAEQGYPQTGDNFTAPAFSDKSVRRGFIRKVYLILTLQLTITVGFVCICMFVNPVRVWIWRHSWFYYLSYAVFIVTYFVLGCCVNCRRRVPMNYIALLIFTLALSYMTGSITAYHETYIVLIALICTVVLCLAITVFAIQTRCDFTMCSGLIFAVSMAAFLTGIACIIVNFTLGRNRILQAVYAGIILLLFSLLLVYHTQQIVGGRKHDMSAEEYVFGAMQLYVDVVFIFTAMLGLIGSR